MSDALLVAGDGVARGPELLHADLHNHTLLSDGAGAPEAAFASMRAAGLDVAAVTDHAFGPSEPNKTIDDEAWRRLGKCADTADEPGAFVAVRGFEWSSPTLGHINVWGGDRYVHPQGPRVPAVLAFYDWLAAGAELAGFNHPGREPGRFGLFRYDPRLADRLVTLELFNREQDYLFEGVDAGAASPLVTCLDAGWRVGLIGVTDEHREGWGSHPDLGRTGLWAPSRDRAGVRAALLGRRAFATRERGLRVDATLGGVPMGGRAAAGEVAEFVLDFGAPPDWTGHTLRLQVLQSGSPLPAVVAECDFAVGRPVTLRARLDAGDWAVLRITDPGRPADPRAADFPGYRSAGRSVAYLSPFFISPGG
ncbi:CehA/McbA family metallohydrolase [Dactylosporangium sp. CA-092794]|uniref:CehA/McbA family metallohydrolase n=1 Tax=Dactylosporangium sp. CA-092794 TaxID=3239929 RepID=UPI003D8CE3ED